MNLEQALNDHLTALNPPQAEVARINQAQHALNTLLRAHFDPQGSVQLGGSWARSTAISPINDVDLLLVVSPSKIPSLLSLNPTELMGKVESELRALLGGGLRRQNRSFGLTWQGVPFDLVLCTTETGDILRLPDLSRSRWLRTSPLLWPAALPGRRSGLQPAPPAPHPGREGVATDRGQAAEVIPPGGDVVGDHDQPAAHLGRGFAARVQPPGGAGPAGLSGPHGARGAGGRHLDYG